MTLLDFPGRIACTVFTGGCNLRCPFCHNALLVTEIDKNTAIPEEEVFSFLKKRGGLLDGVAITGGEPLIQPDIKDFIKKVRDSGFAVKLDTNGCYPDKLKEILDEKLVDYVAMDIKNSPERYAETVGVDNFDLAPIKESIALLTSGDTEYEFRTTITKEFHTVKDVEGAAMMIKGAEKYFLQNFVDSGNLIGKNLHACDADTLENMRSAAQKHVKTAVLRGI